MNEEEYMSTQQQIVLFASLVQDLPLDAFIEAAQRADAIGPIVNPSLWLASSKKLANLIHLASALRKFQAEAKRQIDEGTQNANPIENLAK